MTLNQIIKYAKLHNIDFDKELNIVTPNEYIEHGFDKSPLEQVSVIDGKDELCFTPYDYAYDCEIIESLNLCDTVNGI